jgi:UDPglucose--hexose-1-phosphate uridylyltransferase
MSELRKDPIVGRWVIIAPERAKRPIVQDLCLQKEQPQQDICPFCEGNETMTSKEIVAFRKQGTSQNLPGWNVRVVPDRHLVLTVEGNLDRKGIGMYSQMNGIGAHEIIIETPQHIPNIADLNLQQIGLALQMCVNRMVDLEKDSRLKYPLLFKNYRTDTSEWGSFRKVNHSHSQLVVLPIDPKRLKEELTVAKRFYEDKERCLFCDVIREELRVKERIVFEYEDVISFCPFASKSAFEVWIAPKFHSCDFWMLTPVQIASCANMIKTVLSKLKTALNDPPYDYVLHTAPFRRPRAGYWRTLECDFHWHLEVTPHLTQIAGFEWGSDFYINSIPPEDAAKYLRGVQ